MTNTNALKKGGLFIIALLIVATTARFLVLPPRALANEAEPYRVEMVHNDPYKIQAALNSLSHQGWQYVSSISRTDAKVLLVFRKANP